MNTLTECKNLMPLSKVVNASIVDTYEDAGKMQQRVSHWAARGLKKLYREVLPKKLHKVLLPVNENTYTATLPLDFGIEVFVGYIDERGFKVPFKVNNSIVDAMNVDIPDCEDKCDKCNQNKQICEDLAITEDITLVVINDNTYEKKVTKKLYPNGDYYLETVTPTLDIPSDVVNYVTKKELITNLSLKPCGCLEQTPINLSELACHCPEVYCTYYAPCSPCCDTHVSGYKIFIDSGLIQFDKSFAFKKCYLEYNGFMAKVAGQYFVPEVAFEALVEWNTFKAIDGRKNVPLSEKQWRYDRFKTERKNMEKILGRISLSQIVQTIGTIPKFDIGFDNSWYSCFTTPCPAPVTTTDTCVSTATAASTSTSTTTIINRTSFVLAVKVDGNPGSPVAGSTLYQNNLLIGALDIRSIFAAKMIETILDGDFTLNPATGTIDRAPNIWQTGDTLIVNYNKNLGGISGATPSEEGDTSIEVDTYAIADAMSFSAGTWVKVLVDETEDNNKVMYKVMPNLQLEKQYIIP